MSLILSKFGIMQGMGGLISIDYLIIAGGGGGSKGIPSTVYGAGGGGGGLIYNIGLSLAKGKNYSVSIGSGGVRATATNQTAGTGGNTTFDIYTAYGGLGGQNDGDGGASGAPQSNAGKNHFGATAGGGGGSGAVAINKNGGAGLYHSITCSSIGRAGGGGAGDVSPGLGVNGGGNGSEEGTAQNGTANTGGGGGGSGATGTPGNGGSGVIILLYPDTFSISVSGLTHSETDRSDGYKYAIITAGSGTFQLN